MNKIQQTRIISPLLDKYLMMKPQDKRSDGYHPSSLYKCSRQIWYKIKEYQQDTFPTSIDERKFAVGHAIEGAYDKYFSGMEQLEKNNPGTLNGFKLIGGNVKIEHKGLNLKGEYDKIVEIEGIQYLIDIKTCKDSATAWDRIPYPSHILQVQIYMFMTGVHNGVLLYENKNTQEIAEFHFPFNQDVFDKKVRNKIRYLNKYVKLNKVPQREFEKSNIECMWCDFKYTCWGEKK